MINLIETFKPKRILEVVHGAGSFLFEVFSDKIEMWGLHDTIENNAVTPESLASTKSSYPNVRFVTGLIGQNLSDLPDNYFDLVCSVSVLEHIPHEVLDAVFSDTYRILKPGGIVSHSYDISYRYDTRKVFDAYVKNGLDWLKPADRMTVFREEWLGEFDKEYIEDLFAKLMTENPIMVAETFMWQIPRDKRLSPVNYFTVLNAGVKPTGNTVARTGEGSFPDKQNFQQFTYSKIPHFDIFEKSGASKNLSGDEQLPNKSDVRTYQMLLTYLFIKNNLSKGSRILEKGNQTPILLDKLKSEYDCTEYLLPVTELTFFKESQTEGLTFAEGSILKRMKIFQIIVLISCAQCLTLARRK